MSEHDRRFRDAVQGERKRIASEAASHAASERVQAQIAAKLHDITASFCRNEGCRHLEPALTRTDYGLFGITFRPSDAAMALWGRARNRPRATPLPFPQPVVLRIGAFSDPAEVTSQAVLEQLARSFVAQERAIADLRALFDRLEQDEAEPEEPLNVHPDSMILVWGGVAVLVVILGFNLIL